MDIKERIKELRDKMKERGIEAYIVPSSDPHQSEYVAEHYAARTFITGFTGSAGTAVITQKEACLFTDGRYFIQAESELKGSGVTLFKVGEAGVLTVEGFLKESLAKGAKIAFDGKVISIEYFRNLKKTLESKEFLFKVDEDLIDIIWKDRPKRPCTQVVLHDVAYAGESRQVKIAEVVKEMKVMGVNYYVISGLDDIAWLLNIRARDVECNPLTIAYSVIKDEKCYLFIDDRKINSPVRAELEKANIEIMPYDSIGKFLEDIKTGTLLLDPAKNSTWIESAIKIKIVEAMDVTTRFKAIKNDIQIENIRRVMVRD